MAWAFGGFRLCTLERRPAGLLKRLQIPLQKVDWVDAAFLVLAREMVAFCGSGSGGGKEVDGVWKFGQYMVGQERGLGRQKAPSSSTRPGVGIVEVDCVPACKALLLAVGVGMAAALAMLHSRKVARERLEARFASILRCGWVLVGWVGLEMIQGSTYRSVKCCVTGEEVKVWGNVNRTVRMGEEEVL